MLTKVDIKTESSNTTLSTINAMQQTNDAEKSVQIVVGRFVIFYGVVKNTAAKGHIDPNVTNHRRLSRYHKSREKNTLVSRHSCLVLTAV